MAGADFQYRFWGQHKLSGFALYSQSRDEGTAATADGGAVTVSYEYDATSLGIWTALEHYDPGFRMDTAFYQRTGFNRVIGYFGPVYQPKSDGWSWIKSINPFLYALALHDTVTGMDDYLALAALRMNFVRQGSLRTTTSIARKPGRAGCSTPGFSGSRAACRRRTGSGSASTSTRAATPTTTWRRRCWATT